MTAEEQYEHEKIKHVKRYREYKKDDDEIHKEDFRTYYIGKLMIYRSDMKGWLCDCLEPNCEHISRVKKKYNIS